MPATLYFDGEEVGEIESLQPISEINPPEQEQPAGPLTFEFEASLIGNRIEDAWAEIIWVWRAYETRIRAEAKRAIEEYRRKRYGPVHTQDHGNEHPR